MLQSYRRWASAHRTGNRAVASVVFAATVTLLAHHSAGPTMAAKFVFAAGLYFLLGYLVFDRRPKD